MTFLAEVVIAPYCSEYLHETTINHPKRSWLRFVDDAISAVLRYKLYNILMTGTWVISGGTNVPGDHIKNARDPRTCGQALPYPSSA